MRLLAPSAVYVSDESSYEAVKAAELLSMHEGWQWTYNELMVKRIWPLFGDEFSASSVALGMRLVGILTKNAVEVMPASKGGLANAMRPAGEWRRTDELEGASWLASSLALVLSPYEAEACGLSFSAQAAAVEALHDMSFTRDRATSRNHEATGNEGRDQVRRHDEEEGGDKGGHLRALISEWLGGLTEAEKARLPASLLSLALTRAV
jgi:hypothetical protein